MNKLNISENCGKKIEMVGDGGEVDL